MTLPAKPSGLPAVMPPLIPQKHGGALLRGGKPGNNAGHNGGRREEAFKAACRKLVDDTLRKGYCQTILQDPKHPLFMRALEWACDRGYGKVEQRVTGDPDNPVEHIVTVRFVRE